MPETQTNTSRVADTQQVVEVVVVSNAEQHNQSNHTTTNTDQSVQNHEYTTTTTTPDNHDDDPKQEQEQQHTSSTSRQERTPDPPDSMQECRICLMPDMASNLVEPCYCLGSVRYAHLECLKAWAAQRADLHCEICKAKYTDDLLPQLEPEVKLARERQAARAASMVASRAHRPHIPTIPPTDEEQSYWGSRKFWIRAALLLGLLGIMIGLLLFLGLYAGDDTWAAILLRVLAFALPLLIVLRAVLACIEIRRINREEAEAAAERNNTNTTYNTTAYNSRNNAYNSDNDIGSMLYQRQAQNALSSPV